MSVIADPVIARVDAGGLPAGLRLADALLIDVDSAPRPAGELFDAVFVRLPGLALGVAIGPGGRIAVGFRDRVLLTLRPVSPAACTADAWRLGRAAAVVLYARWAAGAAMTGLSGARLVLCPATGLEFSVVAGRWGRAGVLSRPGRPGQLPDAFPHPGGAG